MTEPDPVDPLDALEPKINFHLHQYGLQGDPLAKAQARLLAGKAVKTYDPNAGASLATWVDRSMRPLSRFKRERSFAIKLPERAVLDNFEVRRAELEFENEHGRLPEMDELADAAGVPLKRLSALRKTVRPLVPEAVFDGQAPASTLAPDLMDEALTSVWNEADKIDREIIERKTGFGGRYAPADAGEVAATLGLTPVQLSRRSARISAKLDEIMELMEGRDDVQR